MLRGRCACQCLTLGRPENEGVVEAGLSKSCLGPRVDLPAGVAELSSRGTIPYEDDKKKISLNCKAKSILCFALSKKEFNRISACKSAMEMWKKLRITYEGTDKVKETRIDILMGDMVGKILRSLPASWTPKVTAIEEANDLKIMSLEKLIGSLMAHEINMERLGESFRKKKNSNALKAEEDTSEEDSYSQESMNNIEDEEAMLSRRLQRILAKKRSIGLEEDSSRREKTSKECPKLKKIEFRKKDSSRKPKRFKKNAMAVAWDNSSDFDSESSSSNEEEEEANLAFMANLEDKKPSPFKSMAAYGASGNVGGYGAAFLTVEQQESYTFVKIKICGNKEVDVADLQKNGLGSIIVAMERMKWSKMATLSEVIYPDLVKAFYVCLKTEEDGSLTSTVKGTQIKITYELLETLFGVCTTGHSGVHTVDIQAKALGIVGPEFKLKDEKIDINQLNAFNRILYFIVCQILVPRSSTYSTYTKADSDMMFWAIQNQSINMAEVMIERMKFASTQVWDKKSKLNVSLPYAYLLTKVFQHFGINLSGAVSEKMGQAIRSRNLKKSGFSLVGGIWSKTSVAEGETIISEAQEVQEEVGEATVVAEVPARPGVQEQQQEAIRSEITVEQVVAAAEMEPEILVDPVAEVVASGLSTDVVMEDAPIQREQEEEDIPVDTHMEDASIQGEQSVEKEAQIQGEHTANAPVDDQFREGIVDSALTKEMGLVRNAVRWVRSELISIKESIAALGDLVRAQSSNTPSAPSPTEPVRSSGPSEARQQDARPSGPISEEPVGPSGPQVVEEATTVVQDHAEAVKSGPSGPIEDVSGPTGPVVFEGEIPRVEEPVVAPKAPDPSPLATPAPPSPPSSSTAPPAPIPFKQPMSRSISSPTPFPSESSSSPAISTSIPPLLLSLKTLQPHHQLEPHLPLVLLLLDHPSYLLLPINPFFILLLFPPLLPLYLKVHNLKVPF
ncbi:hypothetical protein Taro_027378 [Colocasia esculenta]|uniref:Putative plant transposon protein domain-containing protein n=1 Tax=Colocasia esculenta TaxID=4460 RepID=A0A843VNI8_COLES|nr:hypothetical protein [Colocasia esculenta]